MNHPFLLCLSGLVLLSNSCVKPTEPISSKAVAYQVPGCIHSVGKSASADSCFSYLFQDALFVDFCAAGNCCPDSNRFLIQSEIRHDTIWVTIADTAAHLCRCNCAYVLHMEIPDLLLPSYMFICARQDYSSQYILYAQRLYRGEGGMN